MPALRIAVALTLAALAPPATTWPDDRDVLDALNAARTDPADYAAWLRRAADRYEGVYYRERDGTEHATFEGATAAREVADAIAGLQPVPPLAADPILAAAARDHGLAKDVAGGIGRASAAGPSPGARVR